MTCYTWDSGVPWRLLVIDRLVAVPSARHTLPAGRVQLSDLAAEAFTDFPAGTPGRPQSDSALAAAGLRRHVAFEALAPDFMLGLVRHNLAVTLLAARHVQPDPRLAVLAITDGPTRSEYLAWSDINPSPATLAILAESHG
ncbi:LysR substrate-binding domain-containing protein [Frankia sp. AgB32]|uniref:LysR substrate-binding domain-containing protein n=1 Tax=Frankia sp. AgB32 TaxID=631119 RepID=UPI00200C63EF|nr:LysR substrate-binding domain-containing protein [Frankia sp. AgB32]MCK9894494.1 LysR substrate-binding domain-containing protein [Frankia sp. AgB32]